MGKADCVLAEHCAELPNLQQTLPVPTTTRPYQMQDKAKEPFITLLPRHVSISEVGGKIMNADPEKKRGVLWIWGGTDSNKNHRR